jgi:hypothetical protein
MVGKAVLFVVIVALAATILVLQNRTWTAAACAAAIAWGSSRSYYFAFHVIRAVDRSWVPLHGSGLARDVVAAPSTGAPAGMTDTDAAPLMRHLRSFRRARGDQPAFFCSFSFGSAGGGSATGSFGLSSRRTAGRRCRPSQSRSSSRKCSRCLPTSPCFCIG